MSTGSSIVQWGDDNGLSPRESKALVAHAKHTKMDIFDHEMDLASRLAKALAEIEAGHELFEFVGKGELELKYDLLLAAGGGQADLEIVAHRVLGCCQSDDRIIERYGF